MKSCLNPPEEFYWQCCFDKILSISSEIESRAMCDLSLNLKPIALFQESRRTIRLSSHKDNENYEIWPGKTMVYFAKNTRDWETYQKRFETLSFIPMDGYLMPLEQTREDLIDIEKTLNEYGDNLFVRTDNFDNLVGPYGVPLHTVFAGLGDLNV
tara:strand:- start:506 stop:970 length:465 start_codon:yes stop_codon:yes gene_type:complete